jgi:hypothetical protein
MVPSPTRGTMATSSLEAGSTAEDIDEASATKDRDGPGQGGYQRCVVNPCPSRAARRGTMASCER